MHRFEKERLHGVTKRLHGEGVFYEDAGYNPGCYEKR